MKTFHGKQEIKDKYIARVKAHTKADAIVQGQYWENGRGCAVGCTVEGRDRSKYEKELGIPEEIAHLEDVIFERLKPEEAKEFPLRFLEAIPLGVDLSHVIPELVIWQFEDEEHGLKNIKEIQEDKEVYGFCEEVVALYKRELKGDKPNQEEYQELYTKIDWAGAGAWAGAWVGAGALAWVRAGALAGVGALVWAKARAGAERSTALADKFIELLGKGK